VTITTEGGTTNVDIPIVIRSGALTLNGVPVAANEWGADLYYINRTTGDRVLIRDLAWGEYEIELIPGVYDLLYDLYEPRPNLPSNDESLIATGIVVDQSGTLDIDVPMITITGSVTVNGQVAGQPEDAYIYFLQPEIGGRIDVADVSAGSYSVNVIPGAYDIVYSAYGPSWEHPPGLPANRHATLTSQVVFAESGNYDIDVPMVEVTGNLTINGQVVPGGELRLHNLDDEWDMQLATSGVPYATLVVPGTYGVAYSKDSGDLTVPQNNRAILDCIIIE
jgi:phage baseplate assembly protein gpV